MQCGYLLYEERICLGNIYMYMYEYDVFSRWCKDTYLPTLPVVSRKVKTKKKTESVNE